MFFRFWSESGATTTEIDYDRVAELVRSQVRVALSTREGATGWAEVERCVARWMLSKFCASDAASAVCSFRPTTRLCEVRFFLAVWCRSALSSIHRAHESRSGNGGRSAHQGACPVRLAQLPSLASCIIRTATFDIVCTARHSTSCAPNGYAVSPKALGSCTLSHPPPASATPVLASGVSTAWLPIRNIFITPRRLFAHRSEAGSKSYPSELTFLLSPTSFLIQQQRRYSESRGLRVLHPCWLAAVAAFR